MWKNVFIYIPFFLPVYKQIRGEEGDAAHMGVSYEVRLHVADSPEDYTGSKKATVNMSIRKVLHTL